MKTRTYIFFLLAMISLSSFDFGPGKSESSVSFYKGSYDNMLREARKQKKGIILDFWASWCGPCKKMDMETFTDPALAKYIEANYLIFKVDIDTFDGMEITDKFAVESFPSMLIMNHKAKPLEKLKGFYPPHYLEKELKNIVDKYQIIPESYKSELAAN
ncbi:Thioredoxin [Spirosomataceae bacterium TFI 002]|nr:Thioredoxin [Spirosomataceae bacterium TFI 002]